MQDDWNLKSSRSSAKPTGISEAVQSLRATAKAALARSRRSRLVMSQETRQSLQSHRARIRGVAEGICHSARESIDGGKAVLRQTAEPDCEDRKWTFTGEGDTAMSVTEQDLVRVIERHPDGVSLTEIGNQLGTDWRGLVNWSRRLVADGKAERLDELFYPARE